MNKVFSKTSWDEYLYWQTEDKFESEIYFKMKEAELEAKSTDKRYTHDEVFSDLRSSLA